MRVWPLVLLNHAWVKVFKRNSNTMSVVCLVVMLLGEKVKNHRETLMDQSTGH